MIKRVVYIVTRKEARVNPTTLYLFGDNVTRRGFGGQASALRGEPNCIGIRTKTAPCAKEECYFSDNYLGANASMISADIDNAIATYKDKGYTDLVIPPLGTGLAQLQRRAPMTWHHLQLELLRLQDTINNLK